MSRISNQFKQYYIKHQIQTVSKHYLRKIENIEVDEEFELDPRLVEDHRGKWGRLSKVDAKARWLHWYSKISSVQCPNFVPENVFYPIIEPILNQTEFSIAYSDKNFYDLLYPKNLFPETVLRNIDGYFYDSDYGPLDLNLDDQLFNLLKGNNRLLIKPSIGSNGGQRVSLFTLNQQGFINEMQKPLSLRLLKETYCQNFIIQKVVENHPFLAQFNRSSLNTFRVMTYRSPKTNKIYVLHCFFRVGGKGGHVDNFMSGGYAVGVHPKGYLRNFAVNVKGEQFTKVFDIDLTNILLPVPCYEKLLTTALEIASKNIHHRLLGLDIGIDSNSNIRCIEVNNESIGINPIQLLNGPLFGEFTDEVIEFCSTNMDKLSQAYKKLN